MRMWMIHPEMLCRAHLLGEHSELHKHRHNFERGDSIAGRLSPVVQIEPESMKARHDVLAAEMLRRGYRHESPFEQPDLSCYTESERGAKVDRKLSENELNRRCPECRRLISSFFCGKYGKCRKSGVDY